MPVVASAGLWAPVQPDADAEIPDRRPTALPAFVVEVAGQPTAATAAAAIARAFVRHLGGVSAKVYLAKTDAPRLRVAAAATESTATGAGAAIDIDAPLPAAQAARTRVLQLLGDGPVTLALPLLAGDRLVGVVSSERRTTPTSEDIANFGSLGLVLGALLDRAVLGDAARARDEWTTIVAHELAQPLNSMGLQAMCLLRTTVAGGPQASHALALADEVRRLTRLVRDLRDTSLVDIDNVHLHRRPTDLVKLAHALVESLDTEPPSRVHIDVRGAVKEVYVDPERIQQVLGNLLANAHRYGRAGAEVRVGIEHRDEEVLLSVRNEGSEIPEHERSMLFDRYYRAGNGNGKGDGLGIGLYVCRGLVAAHGGHISVESGAGATTFRVELPLRSHG